MAVSSIQDVLRAAALRYGQDPSVLIREAQIESGLNPNARNASGAAGLMQLMPPTAKQYGLENPYDPAASADAGARLLRDNTVALTNGLGRAPTPGEDYLAHQQGAAGALDLLTNPNAPAASIVGEKAVTQNGGTPDMTAGQFANLWTSKFGAPTASLPMAAASAASDAPPAPAPDAAAPPASNLSQAYPMLAASLSAFGKGPITKAVLSTLPMAMAASKPQGGTYAS
jgi:hypothetical protein